MSSSPVTVNYDCDPVLEIEHDGSDYRFDPGKQGTALCISIRPVGTYSWQFLGEARLDNAVLRCGALDRPTRELFGKALKRAMDEV